MPTAQDIIQDAMEMCGIYAPGETMTAADSSRGLTTLNAMIDSWSNESLFTYAIKTNSHVVSVNVASYTIGPGGDINDTRPLYLIDGPGAAYMQDPQGNNYPIEVVPLDQWNLIGSRVVTSNVPNTLYYDPQYPLGIINLFPIPTISWTLFFTSYLQLTDFSNLTSPLSLPPGYYLAITTNLAIALKPYFSTATLDPIILARASTSKGNIKRTNIRELVAVFDPEIVARPMATYNVRSDTQASR